MDVSTASVWALLTELWGTAQHVRKGMEAEPADPVLVRLLAFAEARNGARPSEIAEALEVAHPSVSRYVKALEESGQIEVSGDPDDGRSYLVRVTDGGRAELARFRDQLIQRFAPTLEGWSADEVAALTAALARLNGSMAAARARRTGKSRGRNRWRT